MSGRSTAEIVADLRKMDLYDGDLILNEEAAARLVELEAICTRLASQNADLSDELDELERKATP